MAAKGRALSRGMEDEEKLAKKKRDFTSTEEDPNFSNLEKLSESMKHFFKRYIYNPVV